MHPLKNPNSSYYELWEDTEAIDVIDSCFDVDARLAWAKISLLSYQLRLGRKDGTDVASEMKKMQTFEAYIEWLNKIKKLENGDDKDDEEWKSLRR